MASAYALPPPSTGNHFHVGHSHSHSYSYSDQQHSPARDATNYSSSTSTNANGAVQKKTSSLSVGQLYTHQEVSRETSPLPSPAIERGLDIDAIEANAHAANANARLNGHVHSHEYTSHQHSHPQSHFHSHDHDHDESHNHFGVEAMKSRPRGASDLGRPLSSIYRNVPSASPSWFSLPEALTSLLIPLPYIFASAAYHPANAMVEDGLPPLSAYARLQKSVLEDGGMNKMRHLSKEGSAFLEACTLTSGTLLLVAILAKIRLSERMLDRRKDKADVSLGGLDNLLTLAGVKMVLTRSMSVGLPFYACTQLGGLRTGLVTLVATASGLTRSGTIAHAVSHPGWLPSGQGVTLAIFLVAAVLDFAGITYKASAGDLLMGYLALLCSLFVLPPPLPVSQSDSSQSSSRPAWAQSMVTSPLVSSVGDVNITMATGVLMSIFTILTSFFLNSSPPVSPSAILFSTLSLGSSAAAILFAAPYSLRSRHKAGLGVGCLLIATCAFLFSPSFWPGTIFNGGLSGLSYFGVLYDTSSATAKLHNEEHDHEHPHNAHTHQHQHHHHHQDAKFSWFTKLLIERCEPGSLVYDILHEKDSRRIAYFTCLNFAFMIVQGIYGYISGSLGLLSDTVHMFFDCLGLIVGLGAAVASKWPTSPERPYGWGKLNVLAGFGNGIFLMLVSVEFVWEAMEGIAEGKELRHVEELLVVSTLGFLVNMVGLFAFGHAHAGHDHGHSHGHSDSHSHDHAHSHDHLHDHDHGHSHQHSHARDHDHVHSHVQTNGSLHGHEGIAKTPVHDHGHHEHNENMHGIFLHVAADAGGSAAVIISTALTLWKPWYLWDPLATIIIAILIFAAAVPLVTASGRKLLLVIPDEVEYNIKNTLQELGELRGVVGYAVPRFWLDDKDDASDGHGHHHHGHDHGPQKRAKTMGVIHVIADPAADMDDVRHRVDEFFHERNIDALVHVEREGEGQCWCGGGHWGSGSR